MSNQKYHLAQVNIGRMRGPIDGEIMADFVAQLDEINALADGSPGFVWRLQTSEGNASAIRPYEDEMIIINLSVWESIEPLKNFVYKTAHAAVMRRRREWFEKFDGMYMALWWVEAGHRPDEYEAKARLEELQRTGESPRVFTFKNPFPPPGQEREPFVVTPFDPCPAV